MENYHVLSHLCGLSGLTSVIVTLTLVTAWVGHNCLMSYLSLSQCLFLFVTLTDTLLQSFNYQLCLWKNVLYVWYVWYLLTIRLWLGLFSYHWHIDSLFYHLSSSTWVGDNCLYLTHCLILLVTLTSMSFYVDTSHCHSSAKVLLHLTTSYVTDRCCWHIWVCFMSL